MMNKKGLITLTTVIMTIIITMGLFYAGFEYINANYESANITDELGYNQSYADIQDSQDSLNTSVGAIKDAAYGIGEADANVLLIAWNGLTGLAATIRLFFNIIDIGIDVFNALVPALAFFPSWVKILIELSILITIILVIIGAFKGESKT